MIKRLTLTLAAVAVFGACFLLLHNLFKTNEVEAMNLRTANASQITTLNTKSLKDHAEKNTGKHVYVLIGKDGDSDYLMSNIIAPLLLENGGSSLPHLVVVDLSESSEMTVNRLKLVYGVETYPALIYGSYNTELNIIESDSTLVYLSEKPLTQKQFKEWIFNNGLWKGPYNE